MRYFNVFFRICTPFVVISSHQRTDGHGLITLLTNTFCMTTCTRPVYVVGFPCSSVRVAPLKRVLSDCAVEDRLFGWLCAWCCHQWPSTDVTVDKQCTKCMNCMLQSHRGTVSNLTPSFPSSLHRTFYCKKSNLSKKEKYLQKIFLAAILWNLFFNCVLVGYYAPSMKASFYTRATYCAVCNHSS